MRRWRDLTFSDVNGRIEKEYETPGPDGKLDTAWSAAVGNIVTSLPIMTASEELKNYLVKNGTYEIVAQKIQELIDGVEVLKEKYPDRESPVPEEEKALWIRKIEDLKQYVE